MEDLTQKKCKACEGLEKPLTLQEVTPYLEQVPEWQISGGGQAIERSFDFKDFKEAMNFINKVAELAEAEGHHPDIFLYGYNKVRIILSTHAIKGLSENDFIEAAKIDKILEGKNKSEGEKST